MPLPVAPGFLASGGLVFMHYSGIRTGAPEVLTRLNSGQAVDPADYYFRVAIRFETGAADLAWMNKVIAVGVVSVSILFGIGFFLGVLGLAIFGFVGLLGICFNLVLNYVFAVFFRLRIGIGFQRVRFGAG
jgi:hypothetical protein